jgi:predicted permease
MCTRATMRFVLVSVVPIGVVAALGSAYPWEIENAFSSVLPKGAAAWVSWLLTFLSLPGGLVNELVTHNPHFDTRALPNFLIAFLVSGLFWGVMIVGFGNASRKLRYRLSANGSM